MNSIASIGVVGGGFAGLEALFSLRHNLGDSVDLTLISDHDHFIFKPNTIYIPFGADPSDFKLDLGRAMKKKHVDFIVSRALEVDTDSCSVVTEDQKKTFDFLVVATGAAMRAEEIPGLKEYALTPWSAEEMLKVRAGLQRLQSAASSGKRQSLLFVVPPNNKCSGPLYELVMMVDTWLGRQGGRENVDIVWMTYEESFIQAFGPRLHTVVTEEFESRKIEGHTGCVVTNVEPGEVHFQNGEKRSYDLLLSFPPYIAKESFAGLPLDNRGFIQVDPDSRRVKGCSRAFAAGDASNFPIKQAFLALLQGDAVAEHISAEIQNREVKPHGSFEPVSMCVMEELNKATFAQVPLKYTDDPLKPVTVDLEDQEHYKVGVSPLWRGGKKLLGLYLPWRFGNGEPFHAGLAWDAMDLGLKVMSKVLAS